MSCENMYKMTEFEDGIMKFLTARGFEASFDSYIKEFIFQKKLNDVFMVNGRHDVFVVNGRFCVHYGKSNPSFHVSVFIGAYLIVKRQACFSCGEDILKLIDEACKDAEKVLESLQVRLAEYRMTGM